MLAATSPTRCARCSPRRMTTGSCCWSTTAPPMARSMSCGISMIRACASSATGSQSRSVRTPQPDRFARPGQLSGADGRRRSHAPRACRASDRVLACQSECRCHRHGDVHRGRRSHAAGHSRRSIRWTLVPRRCSRKASSFIRPSWGGLEWFRSNPYDPVYVRAEDRELWSRTCATTTFARLCEPLFFYREGPAGNLRNYLHTEESVRAVLHRYGPPLVGEPAHPAPGDAFTTQVDGLPPRRRALGRQDRLIKRRNRPLTAAEVQEARRILSVIRNTAVSGLAGDLPPALRPATASRRGGGVNPRVLHVTTVPVTLGFWRGTWPMRRARGSRSHALSSPGEPLDRIRPRASRSKSTRWSCRAGSPRWSTSRRYGGSCGSFGRFDRRSWTRIHPKGALLAMMAATVCRVPVRIYHQHGLPLMTATGSKRRVLALGGTHDVPVGASDYLRQPLAP